jgi:hypothetical protein
MSVSAISSSDNPYSMAAQEAATQRRQEAESLADALKAGDLFAAQSAFAALQGLQGFPPAGQNQGVQASGQTTAAQSSLQSLAGALQSGDLAGAQAAFAGLQKGQHGHHHHHAKAGASTTGIASGASNTAGDPATQLLGTTLSVKA